MVKHPEFFEGKEALQEVAKPDGLWNWCLLGPDPQRLPLVAGGYGTIESMKDAIGEHATNYGLVRMSFGTGTNVIHRWVKVDASDEETNQKKGISAVAKGKAAAKAPEMEQAFKTFSSTAVTVVIRHKEEDCTTEHFLKALVAGGTADKDKLTLDENKAAMGEFTERFHDKEGMAQEAEEQAAHDLADAWLAEKQEEEQAAPVQEVEEQERKPEEKQLFRQRSKQWVPKTNEPVMVWSAGANKWFDDGFVIDSTDQACEKDGIKLMAGAVKVLYDHNKRVKWITPQNLASLVKKSDRPAPPKSLKGNLLKETHNLITTWHERHFQLTKGFLQWWNKEEDATNNKQPNGCVSMLGLVLRTNETVILMRSASTNGLIYQFDAVSKESLEKWTRYFELHSKYCDSLRDFYAKSGNPSAAKGVKKA